MAQTLNSPPSLPPLRTLEDMDRYLRTLWEYLEQLRIRVGTTLP